MTSLTPLAIPQPAVKKRDPLKAFPFEQRVFLAREIPETKIPDEIKSHEKELQVQRKLCNDIQATQVIIKCWICDEILTDAFYFDWIPNTLAGYKEEHPLCIDHCKFPAKAKRMPIDSASVLRTQFSIAAMLHKIEKPKDDDPLETGPVFHMKIKPDENFGVKR